MNQIQIDALNKYLEEEESLFLRYIEESRDRFERFMMLRFDLNQRNFHQVTENVSQEWFESRMKANFYLKNNSFLEDHSLFQKQVYEEIHEHLGKEMIGKTQKTENVYTSEFIEE